jgi:hypothetical protein
MADPDTPLLNAPVENEDQLAQAVKISDEKIATDRWKNEGGHTELSQHRKWRSQAVNARLLRV